MFEGADAGDGLDAADACGYRSLAYNFQDADVANAVNVRAATELLRIKAPWRPFIRNRHDSDVAFRILIPKKGERAGSKSVIEGSDAGFDFGVVADFVVDLLLDVFQLLRVDMGKVRKVEAEAFGRIQGAGLLDVGAENVAQRGVNEMRAGMVADDAVAASGICFHGDTVADTQRFLGNDFVGDESRDGIVSAGDFGDELSAGIVV